MVLAKKPPCQSSPTGRRIDAILKKSSTFMAELTDATASDYILNINILHPLILFLIDPPVTVVFALSFQVVPVFVVQN